MRFKASAPHSHLEERRLRRKHKSSVVLQLDHSHNRERRWRYGSRAELIIVTQPVELAVGNVIEACADHSAGCRQTQHAVTALEYVDLPNGSTIARELIADNLLETRCVLHPQEGSAVPVQPIDFRRCSVSVT